MQPTKPKQHSGHRMVCGVRALPYGRHCLDEADIRAVTEALSSDWLTGGPLVERFEQAVASFTGARYAVAVSSGTAALHSALYAAGIGAGDEVIVPALTFVASANAVVFQGGTPVFADVDRETLLLDPAQIESRITSRTKAIIAVDYAGQPCDYDALQRIADRYGLILIADACHALGASYRGRRAGSLTKLTAFSFHPVKHITTGEGGMVTTDDADLGRRMRLFRNHGIDRTGREREQLGSWIYQMVDLGYNYRLSDFQCALGIAQLEKLPGWLIRRRQIAAQYDAALADLPGVLPVRARPEVVHAYHLYVIRLEQEERRAKVFRGFRNLGIGVNVHYIPVHLQPFYRQRFGTGPGLCPAAEAAYEKLLSLPIFPAMSDRDVEYVIETFRALTRGAEAP